ncbi:MAG: sodium:solute symporter family protein [Candidatus Firestonebacteria bacterium]
MYLIIVVAVYLLITAYLGWLGFKQTSNAADYLVAGRKQHPVIMALSYGSTFISTAAIIGFGGVAAVLGMGLMWLTALNIFVGIFIAFVVFGKRTRAMGLNLDAHTFPEFLGKRFDSKFLQTASGLLIFIGMPIYAGSVMIGGSTFMSQYLGVEYGLALLIFTCVVAVYVIFGGLKGVMYTDAFQGGLMLFGMAVLLYYVYSSIGQGVAGAHQQLTDMAGLVPKALVDQGHRGWTSMPAFGSKIWQMITQLALGVGIGVVAQPQLVVRFMTVKSGREINRAVPIGGFFILMMVGVAYTVGALTNVYFNNNPEYKTISIEAVKMEAAKKAGVPYIAPATAVPAVPSASSTPAPSMTQANALIKPAVVVTIEAKITSPAPSTVTAAVKPAAPKSIKPGVPLTDAIIPLFITKAMPGWFAPIFLVTLLAAAMSTLSSQFHTMGTAIGRDVFEQGLGKKGNTLLITKVGMTASIVISLLLAYGLPLFFEQGAGIIAIGTALFFGICATAFSPMYFLGLFWKRATKQGAIWGFILGLSTCLFWLLFIQVKESKPLGLCKLLFGADTLAGSSNLQYLDQMVVSLPVSIIITVLVSLMTKPPNKKHLDKCFKNVGK